MSNPQEKERVSERDAGGSVVWTKGSRPWRVVPLALFAVAATLGAVAATTHVFRDLSGDRYASDVIKAELAAIRI